MFVNVIDQFTVGAESVMTGGVKAIQILLKDIARTNSTKMILVEMIQNFVQVVVLLIAITPILFLP